MTPDACTFARGCLQDHLTRPAAFVYSQPHTLVRGDFYILGLNPRLSSEPKTLDEGIGDFPKKETNSYIDHAWKPHKPGQAPVQRRLRWVIKELGLDLRNVCASNLVFFGSKDAQSCGYPQTANICWQVHEKILEVVQPKCILVFGNSGISPFGYLRDRFLSQAGGEQAIQRCSAGHGTWECKAFRTKIEGRERTVIGLPHLSRYKISDKQEVVSWIKQLLRLS